MDSLGVGLWPPVPVALWRGSSLKHSFVSPFPESASWWAAVGGGVTASGSVCCVCLEQSLKQCWLTGPLCSSVCRAQSGSVCPELGTFLLYSMSWNYWDAHLA